MATSFFILMFMLLCLQGIMAQSNLAASYKVEGKVVDSDNEPLPGVTVRVEGTDGLAVVSDADGFFSLSIPGGKISILNFTYVGMKTSTYRFNGKGDQRQLTIRLEDDSRTLANVVVNGMYTRRAESFTGSSTTFTHDDLQRVGNDNVLKSLANLDPSFHLEENIDLGSNPNSMPNYQMRGATSFNLQGDFEGNANEPLFILDGFETTLQKVYDLDMNRVQSVTLLKDAAAKAIYGSKAGNGVVVIETIRPKSGEIRISYNGNLNIEAPDLAGYNLMNAQEKFDWENAHHKYDGGQTSINPMAADLLYRDIQLIPTFSFLRTSTYRIITKKIGYGG